MEDGVLINSGGDSADIVDDSKSILHSNRNSSSRDFKIRKSNSKGNIMMKQPRKTEREVEEPMIITD